MRNLKEYPLTMDEITSVLYEAYKESISSDSIGDIRPACFLAAKIIIQRLEFETFDIIDEPKNGGCM